MKKTCKYCKKLFTVKNSRWHQVYCNDTCYLGEKKSRDKTYKRQKRNKSPRPIISLGTVTPEEYQAMCRRSVERNM